jgi:hypothetical protein
VLAAAAATATVIGDAAAYTVGYCCCRCSYCGDIVAAVDTVTISLLLLLLIQDDIDAATSAGDTAAAAAANVGVMLYHSLFVYC